MCHFYANPLSVFLAKDVKRLQEVLQPEHLEAVRMLYSFRDNIQFALEDLQDTAHARGMIKDDEYLLKRVLQDDDRLAMKDVTKLLRCLLLLRSTGLTTKEFIEDYLVALTTGIDMEAYKSSIYQLDPEGLIRLATRVLDAINHGDIELGLEGWTQEAGSTVHKLKKIIQEVDDLQERSKKNGTVLRSKYSAQSRVLRTTVVAQKVQLSQDSAQLTEEDKAFTELLKGIETLLGTEISIFDVHRGLFSETWVYDSRSPDRDVFNPQPGTAVERGLVRPHDYLACECCSNVDGDTSATLPATAILYHLYMEAGALVNVADLWSAYYALVVEDNEDSGLDEREALVRFYQGLSELKTMGFVKQSKKKADHIAKLKWL
jgi:origin recognition complex subunit 3